MLSELKTVGQAHATVPHGLRLIPTQALTDTPGPACVYSAQTLGGRLPHAYSEDCLA